LVHEHHFRILLAVRSAPARGGGGGGIKMDTVLLDRPNGGGSGGVGLRHESGADGHGAAEAAEESGVRIL
jgi:hypothetical protein